MTLLLTPNPVYASYTPVTVEESDGSPSVKEITKIKVSNGTLTDNGNGDVTITNSGGSGTVNTGTAGYFTYYPSNGTTVDDQALLFTDGTNIGIGTATPGFALEVVSGASNDVMKLKNTSNWGAASIGFYDPTNAFKGAIGYSNPSTGAPYTSKYFLTSGTGVDMVFLTDESGSGTGTARMTVQNTSGNVGIGTTVPTSLVHVQQSADSANVATPVSANYNSVGAAGELTASSSTQTFFQVAPTVNQTSTAGYTALKVNATETATGSGSKRLLDLQTGGSSKVIVQSDGNVGIGTTTTHQMLHLEGSAPGVILYDTSASSGNKRFQFSNGSSTFNLSACDDSYTGCTTAMQITRSGSSLTGIAFRNSNVGIGTTAPTSLLEIEQSADSTNVATPVMFDVDSVGAAGELTASSSTQTFARFAPVVNQSSTAGYTGLLINATETATGSGSKRLLDLQTGGSSKVIVQSDGNVGIGTTNALYLLDVNGGNVNVGRDDAASKAFYFNNRTDYGFFANGSAYDLDVLSPGNINIHIDHNNNQADRVFSIATDGASGLFSVAESGLTTLGGAGTGGTLKFYNELGATDRDVTIQPSASQTASYTLTLPTAAATSNGQVLASQTDGTLSWVTAGSGSGTVNTGATGYFAYYPGAGTTVDDQTILYTDGTNVGIGTSTTSAKLHLYDAASGGAVFKVEEPAPRLALIESDATTDNKRWQVVANNEQLTFNAVNDATSTSTSFMTVNRTTTNINSIQFPNGNVGVGFVSSPTAKLHVFGTNTSNEIIAEDSTDDDGAYSGISLRRTRSSSTAPNAAGFGANLRWDLETFTNNTTANAAAISGIWEGAQTNNTTDRDGALTFSTMLDNAGPTERMRIQSDGNVGIGTTAPGAKEHVWNTSTTGNTVIEGLRLSHIDSDSAAANGIGTSISFTAESDSDTVYPEMARVEAAMTDVANASKDASLTFYTLGPNAGAGSNTATQKMSLSSTGLLTVGANGSGGSLKLYNELGGTDYDVTIQPSASQTASYTLTLPTAQASGTQVLQNNGSGVLSWATAGSGDITDVGDCTTGNCFSGTTGSTLTGASGVLTLIGGTTTTSVLNLKTTTATGATGADMHFLVGTNGGTEAMTILNNGNVGIGTTNPADPLYVVAGTGAQALGIQANAQPNYTTTFFMNTTGLIVQPFQAGGSFLTATIDANQTIFNAGTTTHIEAMRIDSSGNVGIGTTVPGALEHVWNASTTGNTVIEGLRLSHVDSNTAAANGIGTSISFTAESDSNFVYPEMARIEAAMTDVANASKDASLAFYTLGADAGAGSNTATVKATLLGNGNLGIGTTAPGELLYVNKSSGNANIQVNTGGSGNAGLNLSQSGNTWSIYNNNSGNGLHFKMVSDQLSLSSGGAFSFKDGVTQVFNPNGTNAGINVGAQAGDPSTPVNGDLWYDSTNNTLDARINGSTVSLGAGGGARLDQITAANDTTVSITHANTTTNTTWNWDSLSSGTGLALASSADFTGTLFSITNSGNSATNDGVTMKISSSGTANQDVPLMITNLSDVDSFRVNDQTGDADTTPFIIDKNGNVGIGTTANTLDKLLVYAAAPVGITIKGNSTSGITVNGSLDGGGTVYLASGSRNELSSDVGLDIKANTTTVMSFNTGNSVSVPDGVLLNLSAINMSATTEGLKLPQTTNCTTSTTVEGNICWDTDNDTLWIGNGATATQIGAGGGARLDQITAANDTTVSITHANTTTNTTWNWNSLSSGTGLALASSADFTGSIFTITNSNNSATNDGVTMKITSSGATNQDVPLMITQASDADAFRVNDDGTDTDSTPFLIMKDGKVGIGTTAAQSGAMLTVSQDNIQYPVNTFGSNNSDLGYRTVNTDATGRSVYNMLNNSSVNATLFLTGSSDTAGAGANSLNLDIAGNRPIAFFTNSAERMRIQGAGNVGIGTTAPGALAHVWNTSTTGNTVIEGLRLSHIDSNSAAANGIGTSISFTGESDSDTVYPEMARIEAAMTDVANASKDSTLSFYTLGPNAGAGSNTATVKMTIQGDGNVGIGTTTAAAPLDVNGRIVARPAVLSSLSNYSNLNAGNVASTTQLNPGLLYYLNGTDIFGMDLGYNSVYRLRLFTSSYDIAFSSTGGASPSAQNGFTDLMVIKNSGNVGINTTAPANLLEVHGTAAGAAGIYLNAAVPGTTTNTLYNSGGSLYWNGSAVGGGATALSAITAGADSNNSITNANTTTANTWNFNSLSSGTGLALASSADFTGNIFSITNSGNSATNDGVTMKITSSGTANQDVPLMITNLSDAISFRVNDQTGDADTTPFVIDKDGNVGIGTTTLPSQLNVYANFDGSAELDVTNASNTASAQAEVNVITATSAGWMGATPSNFTGGGTLAHFADRVYLLSDANSGGLDLLTQAAAGDMRFYTGGMATTNERMRIKSDGNVGIGTTTIPAPLTVKGTGSGTAVQVDAGDVELTSGFNFAAGGSNSEADPDYQFINDDNTGMYSAAADSLGFSVGGVGKFVLDGGGTGSGFGVTLHSNYNVEMYMRSASDTAEEAVGIFAERSRGLEGSRTNVQSGDALLYLLANGYGSSSTSYDAAGIVMRADGATGSNDMPGRIDFETTPDGSAARQVRMTIKNNGNVGIGTTGPGQLEHIYSAGNTAFLRVENVGNASSSQNGIEFATPSSSSAGVIVMNSANSTGYGGANSLNIINKQGYPLTLGTNDAVRVTIKETNGNVGIGTATPGALLDVYGSGSTVFLPRKTDNSTDPTGAAGMIYYNSSANKFRCYQNSGWTDCIPSGGTTTLNGIQAASGNSSITHGNNTVVWNWNSNTTTIPLSLASTSLTSSSLLDLSINGTGAASNTQKVLNVSTAGTNTSSGQTTYGAYIANTHTNGTSGTNVALYSTATGANMANYAAVFAAGNVGIGTTAPGAALHLDASQASNYIYHEVDSGTQNYHQPQFFFRRARGTPGSLSAIADTDNLGTLAFWGYQNSAWQTGAEIGAVVAGTPSGNNIPTDLTFATVDASAGWGERIRIKGNGNVGIGTSTVSALLDIGSGTPTTAANGLMFGTDTSANLYRSASATIKTDGAVVATGTGQVARLGAGTTPDANHFIKVAAGTTSAAPVQLTSGTNLTSAAAGAVEYDGKVFYSTPVASARGVSPSTMYSIIPSGGFALATSSGVQSCFPTSGDVWTLAANTTYMVEGHYSIQKATNSVTVAMAFALGGGASVTDIRYFASAMNAAQATTTATVAMTEVNTVSSTVINATSTAHSHIYFKGIIRMNAGGTVTPQINFSGTAAGTPTMLASSYISFTPIGTDTQNTVGNVA